MGIESISRVSGAQTYQTSTSVKAATEAVSADFTEAAQNAAASSGQPAGRR